MVTDLKILAVTMTGMKTHAPVTMRNNLVPAKRH